MKKTALSLALAFGLLGGAAAAMTPEEALEAAIAANACGDRSVLSALFIEPNAIEVECDDDEVVAVLPAVGLAPAAGLAGALLLVLAGGGTSSTPDTQ